MPIIIKRYANRKLYDTEKKRYITLSGIAKYIQEDEDVIVIENTTGEDISNLMLTQIIIEIERENTGLFPKSILAGLIQTSSDTIEIIKRTLTSPFELVRYVNEEIDRRLDSLVDQGKITLEDGIYLRENLISLGRQKSAPNILIESIVEDSLHERGVPSGVEFRRLIDDIERLSEKIDQYVD
jgi:polyhydroxyalkanoate synthesis repressor PhaR